MSLANFISHRFNSRQYMPRSIRAMRVVSMVGIAIAVAALVVALSISRGFEKNYKRSLMDFNAHLVVMGNGELVDHDKEIRIIEGVGDRGVLATTPFLYREALGLGGGSIRGVVVKGIDPNSLRNVNSMKIDFLDGQRSLKDSLNKKDSSIPVIAGVALAKNFGVEQGGRFKLLIPGLSKGKGGYQFKEVSVVGLFESGMHDYDAQFLLMALPEARELFAAGKNSVTGIEVKLADPERAAETKDAIDKILGPRYHIVTWSELNRELLSAVKLEKLVSAIIMSIMVVVAALNIVAVLVLITIHRFHEIAVLKALGVPTSVVRGVLSRGGLAIGFFGVTAGIFGGVLVSYVIDRWKLFPLDAEIYFVSALPIDISPFICGMIALICLGIGFLTSIFASRKLSAVSIAEGLQIAR